MAPVTATYRYLRQWAADSLPPNPLVSHDTSPRHLRDPAFLIRALRQASLPSSHANAAGVLPLNACTVIYITSCLLHIFTDTCLGLEEPARIISAASANSFRSLYNRLKYISCPQEAAEPVMRAQTLTRSPCEHKHCTGRLHFTLVQRLNKHTSKLSTHGKLKRLSQIPSDTPFP